MALITSPWLITIALWFHRAVAVDECYSPDGSVVTTDTPCPGNSTGTRYCCNNDYQCVDESGVCIWQDTFDGSGNDIMYMRGSCTDKNWGAGCPNFCPDGNPFAFNMDLCSDTSQMCCIQSNQTSCTCSLNNTVPFNKTLLQHPNLSSSSSTASPATLSSSSIIETSSTTIFSNSPTFSRPPATPSEPAPSATPASSSPPEPATASSTKLSTGAKAGIGIGVVFGVILAIIIPVSVLVSRYKSEALPIDRQPHQLDETASSSTQVDGNNYFDRKAELPGTMMTMTPSSLRPPKPSPWRAPMLSDNGRAELGDSH